uniref:DNA-directed RNA polymerase n=1 Tax=Millerozyma acaciae TaxID=28986 RepID=Q2P9T0_9ASCO|nr:putative RNA-polymerase [Millerozyma acaciae]
MNETDFGQIKIYEDLFHDLDVKTIKGNPTSCIKNNTSYCGLYNGKELPIMIGSKFDKYENPLGIKGYFIIDGICKSINNIKYNQQPKFSKDRVILSDYSTIYIDDIFNFYIKNKKSKYKWYLPLNWRDIVKYSNHKNKLYKNLEIINKVTNKTSNSIKNEVDLIHLCYMFECWFDLRKPPKNNYRLLTAGEILKNCVDNNRDIIKYFRTNTWDIKNIYNVNTISEDMKHYNIYSDIEAIRRITLSKNRELVDKDDRTVKMEDKYKICPVQTSDGAICGTVNYLCKGATIKNIVKDIDYIKGNKIHLFINNIYKGKIDSLKLTSYNDYILFKTEHIYYVYNDYGYINKGNNILSITASTINNIYNNPPIRSMFGCSMLKQSLMVDDRNLRYLLKDSKFLVNNIDRKINVGIMTWFGYNIEDGLVISESLAKKFKYKRTKIYRHNNIKIINCYIKINNEVKKGDALYKIFNEEEIKTVEIIYSEIDGIVEKLYFSDDFIEIIISKEKNIIEGDKMTSIHGQKGVVSKIESDDCMPYYYNENNEKVILELLINPHAFPTRMTMGQIIEMGDKKEYVYIKDVKILNKILVGKCKYYTLRHQVDDKLQYRNKGSYDIITKQPSSSIKNSGGIRFGQMERDILIGLNAFKTIREIWNIDKTITYCCPKSGIINPDCCKQEIEVNQYLLICLSILRALDYDIQIKDNKYKISKLNRSILKDTKEIKFGDIDPTDVRIYKDIIMLPICLRSTRLNKLYISHFKYNNKKDAILKETKSLLKSKKGYYHTLVEGHKIDRCIRSVITPNPELEIDEVEIPIECNIGCEYGLLNRQPSLNSESLKLVKLKLGNKKTISFNPLLCKSFNADFDGDEMNIYGLHNDDSINELKEKITITPSKTQDYILGDLKEITYYGLTADKEGIRFMIEKESKGKDFNYEHIFHKISEDINENYYEGLTEENWYKLAIIARESIISIALNTPITGHLQSLCIQKII